MSVDAESVRWPDVFIVGAGRSGTTSLHEILRQHPEVRVCDHKSPNFFVSDLEQPEWETSAARLMAEHWVEDEDEYLAMFTGAGPEQILLEASPVYLQAQGVAQKISRVNPQAKIIAILRDPAERAFAHYSGRKRDGIEPATSFEEWMRRIRHLPLPTEVAFGHYTACGQYGHFLAQYFDTFGSENVLVLFYEDFVADPDSVLRSILKFVGADPTIPLDTDVRANRSGEIKNPMVRRLWTSTVGLRTRLRPIVPDRIRRRVGRAVLSDLSRTTLDPAVRSEIIDLLKDDISLLSIRTGRDLSSWLV